MSVDALPRLSRSLVGEPARPVRMVHLGLGGFFRAHQAWHTDRAPDRAEWGIAAFTGRRADTARALGPQDGLYTLVTRGDDADRMGLVGSLSAVHAADNHRAWLDYATSETLAVVTLTVTEAGYLRAADGSLDADAPEVVRDLAALRGDLAAPVSTVPARLFAGLVARAAAGLGPVAVVPCDNLPGNGAVAARVVRDLARLVGADLVSAVDDGASFVTTMVDRITPVTTDGDREAVAERTGAFDAAPVVTEPFSEWVLAGEFPAGRPAWEQAGAVLVDDVSPYEQRKLTMLNGAHSLLAYVAPMRGHETVADAMADPACRGWLQEWWDEAARHQLFPAAQLDAYRADLARRFANRRIRHRLAQIAADGSQKLPVRIVPVLRAERSQGRLPSGAARVVAGWLCHLRGLGVPVVDPQAATLADAAAGTVVEATRRVLHLLGPDLAEDQVLVDLVVASVGELSG